MNDGLFVLIENDLVSDES